MLQYCSSSRRYSSNIIIKNREREEILLCNTSSLANKTMAMSYSRLTQLRLSLKYFRRSCASLPSPKPPTSTPQIAKVEHGKAVVEEKKEEDRVTYELPKSIYFDETKTGFQLFASKKNHAIEVISILNAIEYTPYGIKKLWNDLKESKLIRSQLYIKERAEFLGPELATAHFVCFRGGKVRFYGQEDWIVQDPDSDIIPNLPRFYVESYKMEAVDCSKMTLIYEGLENMSIVLFHKKIISMHNFENPFTFRKHGEAQMVEPGRLSPY